MTDGLSDVRGVAMGAGASLEGVGWSVRDRVAWCARWRRAIAREGDELARLMYEEVGKPRDEAWLGDLAPLLSGLKWLEKRGAGLLGARRLRGTPWFLIGQRHEEVRVPLGRVGVIATWNYPVQLLGIQVGQALFAGNRVVVKPSERCPLTQGMLLDLAGAAGLPRGVLERRDAARAEGEMMLRGERFDHVVFTGSTEVGRAIAGGLAGTLTPSTLELSGRDSAIVLEDADAALAARCVWEGVRFNHGQTCMAPRRVLVVGEVAEAFERAIEGLASGGEVRGVVDEGSAERVRAIARGVATRGGRVVPAVGDDEVGSLVRARVAFGVRADDEAAVGEHFGPLVGVVRCSSEAEALRIHGSVDRHLATAVFTGDTGRAASLAQLLGASQVTVNDVLVPTAHPAASLGGAGASGWGVSRGEAGLLAMTRGVHVSVTPRRIRVPSGPVGGSTLERVIQFVRFRAGAGGSPGGGGSASGARGAGSAGPRASISEGMR